MEHPGLRSMTARHSDWSKDFVKHLRTVHFALMTVCVLLSLLSFSNGRTEVQIARGQIQEISELVRDFNTSWYGDEVAGTIREAQSSNDRLESVSLSQMKLPSDRDKVVQFQCPDGAIPSLKTIIAPITVAGPNWIILPSAALHGQKYPEDFSRRLPQELSGTPASLKEFHELWDNLAKDAGLVIGVPTDFSNVGYMALPNRSVMFEVRPEFGEDSALSRITSPGIVVSLRKLTVDEKVFLALVNPKLETDGEIADDLVYAGEFYTQIIPGGTELDYDALHKSALFLQVKTLARFPFDGQRAMIRHSQPQWKWHRGTYTNSFQQLSAITKNYEALDFKTIDEILKGEEERSGESFEAIGLKIPGEDVIQIGSLLIIALLLYLWALVREKWPLMKNDDEGWQVVWIGVYGSLPAKLISFVSICVLPAVASLCLGLRGLRISSYQFLWSSLPYWSILIVGCLLSIWIGFSVCKMIGCLPLVGGPLRPTPSMENSDEDCFNFNEGESR